MEQTIERNVKLKLKITEYFGTQERIAALSGINEATISKLVRGIRQPTKKQKQILSTLLNT